MFRYLIQNTFRADFCVAVPIDIKLEVGLYRVSKQ